MVDFRLQHVMRIWKAYASGVNFSYQETILLHTMRRQSFASILDSTFYNIWDLAIYSWKVWKPLQRVYDRDLVSFHQGIDGLLRRRLVVLLLTLLHLVCKLVDWDHNFRDLFTITSGTSSTSAIVHFCLSECGAGGGWVLVLSRQVDKWSSCSHWHSRESRPASSALWRRTRAKIRAAPTPSRGTGKERWLRRKSRHTKVINFNSNQLYVEDKQGFPNRPPTTQRSQKLRCTQSVHPEKLLPIL